MTMYEFRNKYRYIFGKLGLLGFLRKIHDLRYPFRHLKCLNESRKRQNGGTDKKFIRLKEFKNIHENQRCFIICTGPSLTLDDVNKLKNEYTFSMNSIIKLFDQTDWRPTYYIIEDAEVFLKLNDEINKWDMKNKFTSDFTLGNVSLQSSIADTYIKYPLDLLNHGYPGIIRKPLEYLFSDDIYSIVYHGMTVTYSTMQIAAYMGFKEIYLLGCDCDYRGEKQHFIDYGLKTETADDPESKAIAAYMTAKKYADEHGIKIYNATRGGKLEVFERVDLDSLF